MVGIFLGTGDTEVEVSQSFTFFKEIQALKSESTHIMSWSKKKKKTDIAINDWEEGGEN